MLLYNYPLRASDLSRNGILERERQDLLTCIIYRTVIIIPTKGLGTPNASMSICSKTRIAETFEHKIDSYPYDLFDSRIIDKTKFATVFKYMQPVICGGSLLRIIPTSLVYFRIWNETNNEQLN